jgi:hypothetical protein
MGNAAHLTTPGLRYYAFRNGVNPISDPFEIISQQSQCALVKGLHVKWLADSQYAPYLKHAPGYAVLVDVEEPSAKTVIIH